MSFLRLVVDLSPANSFDSDPSGAEKKEVSLGTSNTATEAQNSDNWPQELDTSTAILKKKKKPNSLM